MDKIAYIQEETQGLSIVNIAPCDEGGTTGYIVTLGKPVTDEEPTT